MPLVKAWAMLMQALIKIPVVGQPAFWISKLSSLDLGNMPVPKLLMVVGLKNLSLHPALKDEVFSYK
jgi:hypothetical protein